MHIIKNLIKSNGYKKQRGIALLIILLILGSGALYALLRSLNQNNLQTEREKKTTEALALAKQALISYAVSVSLQAGRPERPGDLPCPDTNNNGESESECGNESGSNQATRFGRLPLKTLDLPSLRDGYGEPLWYAVSNNFKLNKRHTPLNSTTYGTITVRNASGNIIHNGTNNTGAIAIIIAPGPPILRQGIMQVRSGAGLDNPINYLDISSNEDNANFIDATLNGFIQGDLSNTANDRISVITYQDLMPLIDKRVVGEIKLCPSASTCHISKTDTTGWWVKNGWQAIHPAP
jgi:type II secretory pathway pseudopilin PulG